MTTQKLAKKRAAKGLKRKRITDARKRHWGVPYDPPTRMKRAINVMQFKGYKE